MGDLTSYVFGRLQPQAIPMEEAVLGAVMLDREAFGTVCSLLKPEHFYLVAHQHIFRACIELANSSDPIDLLTVTEKLKQTGKLDAIGGGYYLVELSNRVASAANVEAHARVIAECHIKREIIRVSTENLEKAYEHGSDAFELLDGSMGGLMGIMSPYQTAKETVKIGDAAQEVLSDLDRAMSGTGGEAVKTGLPKLDQLSGGFFPGEMTIIAARPGMGKTELALTCAEYASLNGKKAHFTTLEMTAKQLARRLMSKRSGVGTGKIRRADVDEVEVMALQDAAEFLKRSHLTISSHRGKNALWQFVRRAAAKKEIDILFVDYAQLMEDEDLKRNSVREQEISAISRTLKRISTEFNIPVVLLAQLSREVEKRADKLPQLSDLRESGSLEQDADNVYFMVRLDQYGIFEYQEAYDNILPAGTYQTAGKILLYSKKFRSDSQFGMMLDFAGGHIFDNSATSAQFPTRPDFDPANVPQGRRENLENEDIPF